MPNTSFSFTKPVQTFKNRYRKEYGRMTCQFVIDYLKNISQNSTHTQKNHEFCYQISFYDQDNKFFLNLYIKALLFGLHFYHAFDRMTSYYLSLRTGYLNRFLQISNPCITLKILYMTFLVCMYLSQKYNNITLTAKVYKIFFSIMTICIFMFTLFSNSNFGYSRFMQSNNWCNVVTSAKKSEFLKSSLFM